MKHRSSYGHASQKAGHSTSRKQAEIEPSGVSDCLGARNVRIAAHKSATLVDVRMSGTSQPTFV